MKKILLISTNALGDTYLTCSAFKPIKDFFKEVKIDIVSTESAVFFLKETGFDNLFLLKEKSFAEMQRLISKIRDIKYDLVFNFFPGQMNTAFFKLSRAEEKIGFLNYIKKKSWHEDPDVLNIKSQPKNKKIWKPTDNYLDRISFALCAAGINMPAKKHIFDFEIPQEKSYDIVLHLFSSDVKRKIYSDSIKEVLRVLCKIESKKVCVLGSNIEILEIKELSNFENLQIEISPDIHKLTGLISNSKLFVGVDSFPLHIADAYGIKLLGIFYYNNEKSVFQNMDNKYIYRVKTNKLNASDLIKFIKEKIWSTK
jgi:ADP-heptose:LPS heptosyltransferase